MATRKAKTRKAPREGLTFVTFILDETGSMQPNTDATISGFNEYLKTLKSQKDECRFTLVLFNTERTEVRHDAVPLEEVKPLSRATYQPTAMTPLYDAIGAAIRSMEKSVEKVSPEPAVIVTILTDGEENSSREYTRAGIFELIKKKQAEKWNFVFLGSNQDAWIAGQKLGVPSANTMTYAVGATGQTMAAAALTANVYRATSRGRAVSMSNLLDAKDLSEWEVKLKAQIAKLQKNKKGNGGAAKSAS